MEVRTEQFTPPIDPEKAAQERRLGERLAKIKHRWLVLSGKGGVGKSTVATNLACSLARRGARVGLLDVDIHGPNIAKMLGLEGQPFEGDDDGIRPLEGPAGVKVVSMASALSSPDMPIIWRGPRKMGAIRQLLADVEWGELDHLVVDSPPGTGDEPLSAIQLLGHADGAIIVTTPQEVALLDSRKCVNFARAVEVPLAGLIENMSGMVCPHCGESVELFGQGGGRSAASELGVPFLGAVPFDPLVVRSGDQGRPFVLGDGGVIAEAFAAIVVRLLGEGGDR